MKETNAIIEILVIGIISFLGISLFLIGFLEIGFKEIITKAKSLKDYSSIILLVTTALSYQLGWLVNKISHYGLPILYFSHLKKAILKDNAEKYEEIRDAVFLKAEDSAIEKLKERLSSIRLLRSGIINFLIFIAAAISMAQYDLLFILVPLFIIFCITSYSAYKDYIIRIKNTYDHLPTNS